MFRKPMCLLLAAVFALSAGSAQAATYKLATNVSEESLAGVLLSEFMTSVDKATDGRVKFRAFHNSVLGDQLQYFQQIQKGIIEAGLFNVAYLENVIPAIGVMNLPFLFLNSKDYSAVIASKEINDFLASSAKEHSFAPLGFISSTYRSLYLAKPAKTVDDVKGMKIRTMSSESYIEMLERFGLVPTPLGMSEVYSGLQMGIIDGAEGGLSGLYDMKMGEVAKHALRTEQTRLSDMVIVSLKFLENLSPEDAKTVQDEFTKLSIRSVEFVDKYDIEMQEKAKAELGVTIVDVDKAPLVKAVEPMYRAAMEDRDKKALLDVIFKIEGRTL